MKADMHASPALSRRIPQVVAAEMYLNVSPVRAVSSAPSSRSCSFKGKAHHRRPQGLDLEESRPRTNSLPSCTGQSRQRHASDSSASELRTRDAAAHRLCRVRSFKMTSKGLVNHGDSLKRKSTHSLMSTGSATTTEHSQHSGHGGHSDQQQQHRPRTLSVASEGSSGVSSSCPPSYFRVALLGAPGVGKSAIIRQFMTSEYRGTFDIATPDCEDPETTVSVLLDGDESMIEFIDEPKVSELEGLRADAFVVVFSLADPQSYTAALTTVRHLRVDLGLDRAILLVGNKVDLARQRKVSVRDARTLAIKYDCQYKETSAALNHCVDELLVTVLSQIRDMLAPPPSGGGGPDAVRSMPSLSSTFSSSSCSSPSSSRKSRSPCPRRAFSFLSKLFSATKKKAKSCDNLLIH